MNSHDIRHLFTTFFEERGHRRMPSSSLIPPPDERTLLFANAGMNQMKPYFMGLTPPPAPRLTSIQKCFRTSDIEAVGDRSHCTFFEMLGNFSVGDYFKAEVIPWAWELFTTPPPKGVGLAKERIWPTIFLDDEEAFELWRQVGVPPERIVRYGEDKNYWFMGPKPQQVGPCGPNTEIFYDFGADQGCRSDCHPNCEQPLPGGDGPCDRYIELWNLVFMTLFQAEDGSRRPLPLRNVDTGGGFERWPMAFMFEHGVDWQGNAKTWTRPPTIYDSDLFQPLLARVGELAGVSYYEADAPTQRAMRIVAEHARAATFLIADGVTPSNEGRGYVLRRLIRRAVYHGRTILKSNQVYMEPVADSVIREMSREYDALLSNAAFINRILREEEERFSESLSRGSRAIDDLKECVDLIKKHLVDTANNSEVRLIRAKSGARLRDLFYSNRLPESVKLAVLKPFEDKVGDDWFARRSELLLETARIQPKLDGEAAFGLWDTLGLPEELAAYEAAKQGFAIDTSDFEAGLEEQRARSRAGARFDTDAERLQTYAELALPASDFRGYETTRIAASVSAILLDGSESVQSVSTTTAPSDDPREGSRSPQANPELVQRVEIVLTQTPFYPEGGGQVGDRGELVSASGRFSVDDTQAVGEGGVIAHVGRLLAGSISVGDTVEARVDEDLRADTMRNHTGTHILHAALRQVLGQHVRQAGSLVSPDRLRFDFTHLEALSPDELRRVEALANQAVRDNIPVNVEYQSYEEALAGGALAFFGDKYADTVRVVGVCDPDADHCFSRELCGGTHVHASGEVGAVIVTNETSIGAGLRRLEAVTGRAATERQRQQEDFSRRLSARLRVPSAELETRVIAMQEENDSLRKQLQATERRLARQAAGSLISGNQPAPSGSIGREGNTSVSGIQPPAKGSVRADVLPGGIEKIGVVNVVAKSIQDVPNQDFLRNLGDGYKAHFVSHQEPAVILLGAVIDDKPSFLAMATPDVAKRCPAGDVVRVASQVAGGGGGGRPELAQGGGTDPAKLDAALAAGRKLIEEKLSPSG